MFFAYRIYLLPASLLLLSFFIRADDTKPRVRQSAWQQSVNYHIEVTLDDSLHFLRGFENIHYINNSPDLIKELYIHLWPNAYSGNQTAFATQQLQNGDSRFYFSEADEKGFIDSLDFFVDGKSIVWNFHKQHADIAVIVLEKPLQPGDSLELSTPFRVKIPAVFSRLGHVDHTYNITQWYPKPAVYDANGWNPMPYLNQGEFYSEFGKFDVSITLPKNYLIAATGVLLSEYEQNYRKFKGKRTDIAENPYITQPFKTVRFLQDNVHDFAWFASENFGCIRDEVNIAGQTIESWVFSNKESDLNNRNLEAIQIALKFYSENALLYPYKHATVVKSDLKAGGGMEYPMITVCDVLAKEIIVHEVGHNWFYGILGSNERMYPWMDESINSFYEAEAIEAFKDPSLTLNKQQNFLDNINDLSMELIAIQQMRTGNGQAVGLPSEEYTQLCYGTMVYGKGALIFRHLRAYLGEQTFRDCFRAYSETWKYRHPLPGDMQDVFERVSGKKLDWFFSAIINDETGIDYKFAKVIKTKDSQWKIRLRGSPTEIPVPVVALSGSNRVDTLWLHSGKATLVSETEIPGTDHFLIDPDKTVIDINRKNNSWRNNGLLKRHPGFSIKPFTNLDIKTRRKLFWMPLSGYNIHNGMLAGIALHNWSFPQRRLSFMAAPMFGLGSNTLAGLVSLDYVQPLKGKLKTLELGLRHASFAFAPRNTIQNYHRNRLYAELLFRPEHPRSLISNKIRLTLTDVEVRNIPGETGLVYRFPRQDISVIRLTYTRDNKKVLYPNLFRITLETGANRDENPFLKYSYKTFYFKPGLEYKTFINYKKAKKGLNMRFFAGDILQNYLGVVAYRLGGKNGQYDYALEHSLMGRGASEGIWSSSLTPGEDQFKLKGNMGNISGAFVTINLNSTLPGKIPIRPYVDFCFRNDDFASINGKDNRILFSGGVAVVVVPDMLEIYFPLAQSLILTDSQNIQGFDTFGKKICFLFNLNELDPRMLAKRVKLF